jgi:intraflagellar transport protein 122
LLSFVRSQVEGLSKAAGYFRKHGHIQYTTETYMKIGDLENMLDLYIESHQWDEAFKLLETTPKLDASKFYLPYANWLAVHDRFEEAQEAFHKAGKPEASSKVLEQLTHNAVIENRFEDAAYYFWLLSKEYLRLVTHNRKGN